MNIKIGLIGLPNVGKTSLLSFLTSFSKKDNRKNNFLIANYPFATIEPNIGVMLIPDHRVENLSNFYKSKKNTLTSLEIFDVAGLIKGAAEGLGLGNQFLSHIRQVDLICQVIRCFKDKEIEHVNKLISPSNDYEIINFELISADLQQIEKYLEKLKIRDQKSQQEKEFYGFLIKELAKGKLINKINLSSEEKEVIKKNNFLTAKPFFMLANYSGEKEEVKIIEKLAKKENISFFSLAIKLENDLISFSEEEKKELNWKSADLFLFGEKIKKSLNLKVFFTVGSDETKSWLIKKKATARECASLIHSDIGKNFTQLEVYNYEEWKENQKIKPRRERSDYLVKEGDICHFLFSKGIKK